MRDALFIGIRHVGVGVDVCRFVMRGEAREVFELGLVTLCLPGGGGGDYVPFNVGMRA